MRRKHQIICKISLLEEQCPKTTVIEKNVVVQLFCFSKFKFSRWIYAKVIGSNVSTRDEKKYILIDKYCFQLKLERCSMIKKSQNFKICFEMLCFYIISLV